MTCNLPNHLICIKIHDPNNKGTLFKQLCDQLKWCEWKRNGRIWLLKLTWHNQLQRRLITLDEGVSVKFSTKCLCVTPAYRGVCANNVKWRVRGGDSVSDSVSEWRRALNCFNIWGKLFWCIVLHIYLWACVVCFQSDHITDSMPLLLADILSYDSETGISWTGFAYGGTCDYFIFEVTFMGAVSAHGLSYKDSQKTRPRWHIQTSALKHNRAVQYNQSLPSR